MNKKLVRVVATVIIVILTYYILGGKLSNNSWNNIKYKDVFNTLNPVKISVLFGDYDEFNLEIRKSLEKMQKENEDKVQFVFYDAKDDQNLQNKFLDEILKEGTDLLIINLVDADAAQGVINKIKETNVPIILFNKELKDLNPIRSYNKAIYLGTDAKESGILQGEIIVNKWNEDRCNIDRNCDNILQYIMLMGKSDDIGAIDRTKYSIETIEKAGIKTEELALRVANWDRKLAREAIATALFKYGNKIEAIIANNDAMAIGAIEALQAIGYNKGDKSKTITVVGIDALEEAEDLIAKGFMTGTVIQDDYEMAEALYTIGMNLISKKSALEDTQYKFDETGVCVRIPYKEYK